eukprot:gene2300-5289_t
MLPFSEADTNESSTLLGKHSSDLLAAPPAIEVATLETGFAPWSNLTKRMRCATRCVWITAVVIIAISICLFVIIPNIAVYHPLPHHRKQFLPGPPEVFFLNVTSSSIYLGWMPPNIT